MFSQKQIREGEQPTTVFIGGKEYQLPEVAGTVGQYLVVAADGKSLEWKS